MTIGVSFLLSLFNLLAIWQVFHHENRPFTCFIWLFLAQNLSSFTWNLTFRLFFFQSSYSFGNFLIGPKLPQLPPLPPPLLNLEFLKVIYMLFCLFSSTFCSFSSEIQFIFCFISSFSSGLGGAKKAFFLGWLNRERPLLKESSAKNNHFYS